MAGLGRRTFAAGEVLTAGNVMGYLQDQAVMNFAGTAARGSAIGTAVSEGMVSYLADNNFVQAYDGSAWRSLGGVQVASGTATRNALLPSPIQGDKVFRTDLGFEQTYYSAYGTANPGGRGSGGWYDNQRNMGLVPIVPPTVNVSGGTATANSLGVISFTNATSISFNNVFTAAYRSYKIIVSSVTMSIVGQQFYVRMRSSGTDLTSNVYNVNGVVQTGTGAPTSYSISAQPLMTWAALANEGSITADVHNPAVSSRTNFQCVANGWSGAVQYIATSSVVDIVAAYDGITFYPQTGNFTGQIQILGYNS